MKELAWIIGVIVAIGIGIAILAWARVITLPYWLSFERKAYVSSHQYVEAKRRSIATMVLECAELDHGPQRDAIRRRINEELLLIPEDARIDTGDCR